MEANYFTILWWFLPYFDMNQPQVYMCPHPESPSHFPPCSIPLTCPRAPALSALLHALNLHWSSVLHMVIHICFSAILSNHLTLAFSHIVQKYSLYLCLFCCLAYRVVITVFLNSIYICINILYWCFFFWFTSICIIDFSFITSLELIQMQNKDFI